MINEFYTKEATTPDEARVLINDYLKTISSVFHTAAVEVSALAYQDYKINFRGSDNQKLDNQMMIRKLVEKFKLSGVSIAIPDSKTYTLDAKRTNPVCYTHSGRGGTHRNLDLDVFITHIFEQKFKATHADGTAVTQTGLDDLNTLAEIMRKYFIMKPDYLRSINIMCETLLDTYFLINVPSPLITLEGTGYSRFITGDQERVTFIKKNDDQRYHKNAYVNIDTYIKGEFYNTTNLVNYACIVDGITITGDQSKNITTWNALRELGKKYITDEQIAEVKTLGISTLNDALLTSKFNSVI